MIESPANRGIDLQELTAWLMWRTIRSARDAAILEGGDEAKSSLRMENNRMLAACWSSLVLSLGTEDDELQAD